jgi:hypothetical protein
LTLDEPELPSSASEALIRSTAGGLRLTTACRSHGKARELAAGNSREPTKKSPRKKNACFVDKAATTSYNSVAIKPIFNDLES